LSDPHGGESRSRRENLIMVKQKKKGKPGHCQTKQKGKTWSLSNKTKRVERTRHGEHRQRWMAGRVRVRFRVRFKVVRVKFRVRMRVRVRVVVVRVRVKVQGKGLGARGKGRGRGGPTVLDLSVKSPRCRDIVSEQETKRKQNKTRRTFVDRRVKGGGGKGGGRGRG
jgi:hypothetical protein